MSLQPFTTIIFKDKIVLNKNLFFFLLLLALVAGMNLELDCETDVGQREKNC